MNFYCPNPDCQVKLKAKPEQAGRQFHCPKCRTVVTVPSAEEASTGASRGASLAETPPPEGDSTSQSASRQGAAEDGLPEVWNVGDVILDLYEVKRFAEDDPPEGDIYREGGFGRVYRVGQRPFHGDIG